MASHLLQNRNSVLKQCILLLLLVLPLSSYSQTPVIAVASNLSAPLTEIITAFKVRTGIDVRVSFGSSGNLSRQIVQGAPFELFISADRKYIDFIQDKGVNLEDSYEFSYGMIGLFIPADSSLYKLDTLEKVINALEFRSYRRIALANPEHAPYGVAALEALHNAGLWALEQNRMILAESVAQVVPYALSGNVDAAVIPSSFMYQNELAREGRFFLLPEEWYRRITQYIAIMPGASLQTEEFSRFLTGEESHEILRSYGYTPSGQD